MIKSDKDILLGYIEELLLSEKDIVVLSDDNDIINIDVNGRSFFLYIKSLTYAGNPYPLNTTRAQLPRRDDFKSIKDSNAIFLFLGYDEENEVFACWEPTKTKARLNEKQYVSFFSRLHLQVIAKEKDFVKTSLQNGLKYVLFRLDILPKFLLTIDDFFPDLISYGLPETPEINQGKIFDLEDDSSIVSFIEELYKNDTNESILSLVSSCINKFGKTYYNMTLRDWQILVSEYIEQKHPSISEDDEIEEKIADLIETENNIFLEDDNNARQLSDILESEVLPESSEGFRNYLNKILSYPNFSLEETKELLKRYYDGDKKSFDLLVKSNLKIVVNIACLFRNCGASLEDLIQVGSMGLINAIKFYRNKNGANFNSYIRFGIYAFISDSALDLPYLLTLPARIVNEHIKFRRLYDKFEQQNDYPPSIDEIDLGEEVGVKRKIFLSQLPPDFRDSTCYIDDFDSFEDNSNMPDVRLTDESIAIYVLGIISLLPERNGQILQAIYGLNGFPQETMEGIGKRLNLTRERVRQLREKSLRILKIILGVQKDDNGGHSVFNKDKQRIIPTERIIEERGYDYAHNKVTILRQQYLGKSLIVPQREQIEEPLSIKKPVQRERDNFYDYSPKRTYTSSPQTLAQNVIKVTKKSPLYSLSTTLQQLYRWNLLTQKECTQCHNKGLYTIGDVQKKIKKYNLTPESTRFTKYTLDMWFKIVALLDKREQNAKKVITLKSALKSAPKPAPKPTPTSSTRIISDKTYMIYTQKIMKLYQSSKYGVVNVAKPVLLLAIIDGVGLGEILYNRILLDERLEERYNGLMKIYSNFFVYRKITPINMPFWYLQTDGFWHIRIKGDKKINAPTTNWLKENVLCASLDEDLWVLLENKEWRMKLRNFIIEHKLQAAEI